MMGTGRRSEEGSGRHCSGRKARYAGPVVGVVFLIVLMVPAAAEILLRFLFPEVSERVFDREPLAVLLFEHLALSLSAGLAASIVGAVLGVVATRPRGRAFLPLIRDATALAQTIPPAAVLALAIPFLGFGTRPVLLALVLYSILPVLNNTVSGLEALPGPVVRAARGMGMTPAGIFFRIELPLALPVIGSGVRTAMVINVGTATIGALAGAGGLGSPIVAGLVRNNPAWVFQGAAAAAVIALLVDAALKAVETRLSRRGGASAPPRAAA